MSKNWLADAFAPELAKNLALFGQVASQDEPYFAMFGRFIASFAGAESAVHMLARKQSGLSDQVARVIFGGMRLPDLTPRIRQMLRITRADNAVYTAVDKYLTQLDLIGEQRHKLVHRNVDFDPALGKLAVSNQFTAKFLDIAEFDHFSINDLDAMREDATRIFVALVEIVSPFDGKSAEDLAHWTEWKARPWRYKPVPPPPQKKSPQKAPKAQRRRPDASQG